jgi:hypothetical protein
MAFSSYSAVETVKQHYTVVGQAIHYDNKKQSLIIIVTTPPTTDMFTSFVVVANRSLIII